jgi:hypothetical protein
MALVAVLIAASCGREDRPPLYTEIHDVEGGVAASDSVQEPMPEGDAPETADPALPNADEEPVWLHERLWSHGHPWNVLTDGSFEQWDLAREWPAEWKAWAGTPEVRLAQQTAWHGNHSARLTGDQERYCVFALADLPPPHEMVGKEVVFCAWVRTDSPQQIEVGIFDNVELPHVVQPSTWNAWELLAEIFEVGIGLMPNDPPASCHVDGVALYIGRELPWPPGVLEAP